MEYIPLNATMVPKLVALWNKELGDKFPMRKELLLKNSFEDENVLQAGSWAAVEDGIINGVIVSKRWQENLDVNMNKQAGWIQMLLVSSECRGQGVGSVLLEKAESALLNSGAKSIFLGRDPWHYFPGIPAEDEQTISWFEQKGYQCSGSDYDMMKEYEGEESENPCIADAEIAILQESEKDAFLAFMRRVFPGRWEYEAIHYFMNGGTGREFVVLKKSGNIIGFCRVNDACSPLIAQNVYWAPLFKEPLGGIGPLGVDSSERKRGYGIAVVQAGISELKSRNIRRIVIDWTGLVDFYGKLGYHPWKEYKKYSKEM